MVAPLLHSNEPTAEVDKTEFPQLFVTVTTGVAGTDFGAASPLPAALVQPFAAVAVIVYAPGVVTVIAGVVSPLLHNNDPVAVVDNTELPQLLVTVTAGAAGTAFGADIPIPARLVQPSTVVVTE